MPFLRVLAGPSPTSLVPITDFVNTNVPHFISSDVFEGEIVVNIKDFTDSRGRVRDTEYFRREDRKGITWSIQVQGRFLVPYSADDILFGNTFDKPLRLPWGSGAALKFMKYVDPTLEHDLASPTKPWALSPLISTMPHFAHRRLPTPSSFSRSSCFPRNNTHAMAPAHLRISSVGPTRSTSNPIPPFPPSRSIIDDNSQLHLALVDDIFSNSDSSASSSASSLSSTMSWTKPAQSSLPLKPGSSFNGRAQNDKAKAKRDRANSRLLNLHTASQRRSYFSSTANRRALQFGPNDVITTDFCYGFLEFSPKLSLCIPGGLSFDLMQYWDGQPVRFVCCERKGNFDVVEGRDRDDEPWGRMFWCVVIELGEEPPNRL